MPPQKFTIVQAEDALLKNYGNVSAAARALKVDHSTLWHRIKRAERLQAARVMAKEQTLDLAENALVKAVKKGEAWALCILLKTQGKERMDQIIGSAMNDTEFALDRIRKKYDTATEDGKLNYMNEAVELLAEIGNEIERDLYTSRLASETGIEKQALEAQISKARRARGRKQKQKEFENALEIVREGSDVKSPNPQKRQFRRACAAEEIILASLLKHPDYLRKLKDKLSEDVFVTDYNKRYFRDLSSRIREGRSLDLSVINETADNEEMAYLSYLLAKGDSLADSLTECEQCIQTLLSEKTKADAPNVGKMSNDEFRALFRKNKP